MARIPGVRRLFRLPASTRRIAREVDEELAFHFQQTLDDLTAAGMTPADARAEAVRRFGDVGRTRASLRRIDQAHLRGTRRAAWWEATRQDLRYAARSLRRSPGFALVAVLALAIGIGMSTAMFTVVNAVLLRPLPVYEQNRVLVIWGRHRTLAHVPFTLEDLQAFRNGSQTLESVAAVDYYGTAPKVMRDGAETLRIPMSFVSGNIFHALGVTPVLGRTLRPEDDVVGAAPVIVISYGLWQRQFGGRREVLGQGLVLHAQNIHYTIVGVLPEGFTYPAGGDVWAPIVPFYAITSPLKASPLDIVSVNLVGRLRPGTTPVAVGAELAAYFHRDGAPKLLHELTPVVHTLPELILGDVRPVLLIFCAAVALLLLIACVNVANLLLIRASARTQELAIRAALGAGRRRLVRQLLTESLLLGASGGALGVVMAAVVLRGLVALAPVQLPRLDEMHLDATALGAAVAISLLTVALFGALPSILTARANLSAPLRSGARGGSLTRSTRLAKQALVVWQVALALLVLAGAGLVTRSVLRLQHVGLGFDAEHLDIAQLTWPLSKYPDTKQGIALFDRIMPRIEALPGVVAATPLLATPFSGARGWDGLFMAEGQGTSDSAANPYLDMEVASPDYFRTFGLPIRRGRGFTDQDREGSVPVVVVSEAAAHRFWPGENPIGKRLSGVSTTPSWLTVIGVAGDTRYRALRATRPTIYYPSHQFPFPFPPTMIAIRTRGSPAAVFPAVRHTVASVDPDVLVSSVATFDQLLAGPLAQPRFNAILLAAFALAALLLAAIGIYAVIASMMRQRTREMAIRVALGAQSRDVWRMVLRQGVLLAALGVVVGLAASVASTRALSALLFEVSPTDPLTLAAVSALLLAVAVLACAWPARRATRVDPAVTLRTE